MATNILSDISQRTQAWADATFLKTVAPVLVTDKYAQVKTIPGNTADNAKFRRRVPFTVTAIPLTEGVTPTGQQIRFEDVSVQLRQYGSWVQITDNIQDMAEDPVWREALTGLAEQAAATKELVNFGVLRAGTSVRYTNGTTRTDVNTPLTVSKLQAAVKELKIAKAPKITKVMSGSANYATYPINASYIAFVHPHLEPDIRALPSFRSVESYGSGASMDPNEIGQANEVRLISSPDMPYWADGGGAYSGSGTAMQSTSGTSADVFPIIVIGQDAWATVTLKGKGSVMTTMLPPNVARHGDPLGQVGSVGWKTRMAAVILDQTMMTRIECAATAI